MYFCIKYLKILPSCKNGVFFSFNKYSFNLNSISTTTTNYFCPVETWFNNMFVFIYCSVINVTPNI